MKAEDVIKKFDLKPLPEEGGYYRETYRSSKLIKDNNDDKSASTAIFYMVTPADFSALHRIKYDEIFHFYGGDPVEMIQIDENGELKTIEIGSPNQGLDCQVIVPAQVWQGLRLKNGGHWALLGTTVAPGFEFKDFEIKSRNELSAIFPTHTQIITSYTR